MGRITKASQTRSSLKGRENPGFLCFRELKPHPQGLRVALGMGPDTALEVARDLNPSDLARNALVIKPWEGLDRVDLLSLKVHDCEPIAESVENLDMGSAIDRKLAELHGFTPFWVGECVNIKGPFNLCQGAWEWGLGSRKHQASARAWILLQHAMPGAYWWMDPRPG